MTRSRSPLKTEISHVHKTHFASIFDLFASSAKHWRLLWHVLKECNFSSTSHLYGLQYGTEDIEKQFNIPSLERTGSRVVSNEAENLPLSYTGTFLAYLTIRVEL